MKTVQLRLRRPTQLYVSTCPDIELQRGDPCIVRSDRGLEYAVCVEPPESCSEEIAKSTNMSVVRKATHVDESNFHQLRIEENKAREVCVRQISRHNLPMKLVDVEYTFDKHKVTFFFTAAERVDFRQLVRDLAQELKTRIELRHIQVRDEAKITGGLGVCGRELCCACWLCEFRPISMKMAKRQNLSLNPSKISGQCGRLLCCLSYEDECYGRARRKRAEPRASSEPSEDSCDVPMEEDFSTEPEQTEPDDSAPLPEAGSSLEGPDALGSADEDQGQAARSDPGAEGTAQADGTKKTKRKRRRRRKRRKPGEEGGSSSKAPGDSA